MSGSGYILTKRQQLLIDLLVEKRGQPVGFAEIGLRLGGLYRLSYTESRALGMLVCGLRKRMGDDAWRIRNVFGLGYLYVA